MKKIITALMGTVSGLVLLFSYHTSTISQAVTAATTASTTATDTGSGATADSGSGSSSDSSSGSTDSGSGSSSSTDAGSSDSSSTDSGSTSTDSGSSSSSGSVSGTFTGDAVQTRYGAVQVQITVEDGVIVSSEAIDYPNSDRHDQQINAYAIPVLNAEPVEAQSADIDSVSGATVSSVGYIQSLQSAIDQAFQ